MRGLILSSCALALIAAGCENPGAGKPQAEVAEAAAVAPDGQAEGQAQAHPGLPITPESSKIGFTGSKVTGKHDGVFEKFAGALHLDPAAPEKSRVTVDIDVASVKTDEAKLDEHLKSGDFFDVAKFPKASFVSTAIAKGEGDTYTVTGNLTLRGTTKSISFPAKVNLDEGKVKVNAEFNINRKDFNIVYPGMPDDLIRDEVVIRLDLAADRPAKS